MKTTARHVLDCVPRVGFYPDVHHHGGKPWPEDIIFPSCMRAVMEYLGHPEYDYVHFMGVTGAGFFHNWEEGWHMGNAALYHMAPFDEHMKLFEYAWDSTGYALQVLSLKGKDAIDKVEARRRVIASIDAGLPVLSHGVVGPPETSLITGYDEGGDVLIGWSSFQAMPQFAQGLTFEPNGMFRKSDWYDNAWDLFLSGTRGDPVDVRTVRRRSLQWASKVVRTATTWGGNRHNGLAAYDAWARHLLRDADITPDGAPPAGSDASPFVVHDDAVGTVAECRWYAARYLARVAGEESQIAAQLYDAAACYAREHDLMWQIWACVGGSGRSPEHVRRFADPDTRRRIVELIHDARRLDERAMQHIEAALRAVA